MLYMKVHWELWSKRTAFVGPENDTTHHRPPKMVDYSRFDNIDVSSDDDDDDAGVTRFDAPHSVTFGGGQAAPIARTELPSDQPANSDINTAKQAGGSGLQSNADKRAQWTRNGGSSDDGVLLWSQSADGVELRVCLPLTTRARQVSVAVDEKHVAVTCDGARFDVPLSNSVDASDDAVMGAWQLHDDIVVDDNDTAKCRWLCVSLRKQSPVPGTRVWWNRLRPDDSPIDENAVVDRQGGQASFANVWEEAHKEFRKRRAEEKAKNNN